MTTVLPIDYVTILEATEMLQTVMHAGKHSCRKAARRSA
jgi:hypothetical protein